MSRSKSKSEKRAVRKIRRKYPISGRGIFILQQIKRGDKKTPR